MGPEQLRRTVAVEIYYPGAVISVNHYTGRSLSGRTYVRLEARAWMDALGWLLKSARLDTWRLPLEVECSARFSPLDKRRQVDLSNLSKCTLDAIEDLTGIDDRNFLWRDGRVSYGEPPRLMITVTESQ